MDITAITAVTAPSSKSKKPIATYDPRKVDALADRLDKLEALSGLAETEKSALTTAVYDQWITHNQDSDVPVKTLLVEGITRSLNVTFTSRFAGVAVERKAELVEIFGDEEFEANFEEKTNLGIDFSKIPEAKRQTVFNDIVKSLKKHGVAEAASAKQVLVPVEGFNDVRATKFTLAQNKALEGIQKTTIQIKRNPIVKGKPAAKKGK